MKIVRFRNYRFNWAIYKSPAEIITIICNNNWFNKRGKRILTCIDSSHLFLTLTYNKINISNIEIIELDSDFIPNIRQYLLHINNISLIVLSHNSNITGLLTPIRLYNCVKNKNTVLMIDGTKAVSDFNINIEYQTCDIYLISPNNTHAFSNICLCFIKSNLLTKLNLKQLKHRIANKSIINLFNYVFNVRLIVYNAYPTRILDIIWMSKTYKLRQRFSLNQEKCIYKYLLSKLSSIRSISLISNRNQNSTIICFRINDISTFEVVAYLNKSLIHRSLDCYFSMPSIEYLKHSNACRITINPYNKLKDADILLYNIMQLCYLSELKAESWIKSMVLNNIIINYWSQYYSDPMINKKLKSCPQDSSLLSWSLFFDKYKQRSEVPFVPSFTEDEYIKFNLLFVLCFNLLKFNNTSTYNFIVRTKISIYKNDIVI
ncbi:Cysteine desulfurase [Candidatus Hodgkinia cicadicola]|uniref:Cysteine desulfurase n=1 Tax=Candidatus Hodgkinia cicadicola TaxID=573658 RepID=A0ABX4MH03_9HYPH|nr:Cysteine desulfurase [Candidatus Hodgkinia cicadicola]